MNTLTDVTDEPLPLAYGPPETINLTITTDSSPSQHKASMGYMDEICADICEVGMPNEDAGQILPTPQETFDKVYAEVMATMPVEEPEESPLSSPSPEEKMARIESGSVPRRIRRKLNREMGLNGDRGDALRVQKSKWDNALEELKDGKILFIETSESECWVIRNLASRRGLKVAKRDGKVYLRENAPKMIRRKG